MKTLLGALVILFFIFPCRLSAQYYYYNEKYFDSEFLLEFGVAAGGMNCLTDLGGKKGVGKNFIKDLNITNTKFCFGTYATLIYKNVLCITLKGTIGKISAYDSILKDVGQSTYLRYERNLSFRSSISELFVGIEVHPLFFKAWDEPPRLSPYLLAAIGYFHYKPETEFNHEWIPLQPLHTEGQGFRQLPERKNYQLYNINFPLGIGIKYELSSIVSTRFEVIYRLLTTDYLDDVSTTYIDPTLFLQNLTPLQAPLAMELADRQSARIPIHTTIPGQGRGNSENNDSYFSMELKVGYTFRKKRHP